MWKLEYLTLLSWSSISKDGRTDTDILGRIAKTRTTFLSLKQIWRSKTISQKTTIHIFNTNVKSVLVYGGETWREMKAMTNKLQTFVNKCQWTIFGIHWPETVKNEELEKKWTGETRVADKMEKMGLARINLQKTPNLCCETVVEMEPPREKMTRQTKKLFAQNCECWSKKSRIHME